MLQSFKIMEASFYQSLKPVILSFFSISKDAIHIHIGFVCLALTLFVSSKKISSLYALLPGLFISVLMEILDLWDGYRLSGTFKIAGTIHDLVNTNLIPVMIILLVKTKKFNRLG